MQKESWLPDWLLCYYLTFPEVSRDEKVSYMQELLSRLPDQNYIVLKHLMEFLSLVRFCPWVRRITSLVDNLCSVLQVMDRSCLNKMTSSNLAVVFGPNLVWSNDQSLSLANIGPINSFTEFLLVNQDHLFAPWSIYIFFYFLFRKPPQWTVQFFRSKNRTTWIPMIPTIWRQDGIAGWNSFGIYF